MALTRPEGSRPASFRTAAQRRTEAGRLFCFAMQSRLLGAVAENSCQPPLRGRARGFSPLSSGQIKPSSRSFGCRSRAGEGAHPWDHRHQPALDGLGQPQGPGPLHGVMLSPRPTEEFRPRRKSSARRHHESSAGGLEDHPGEPAGQSIEHDPLQRGAGHDSPVETGDTVITCCGHVATADRAGYCVAGNGEALGPVRAGQPQKPRRWAASMVMPEWRRPAGGGAKPVAQGVAASSRSNAAMRASFTALCLDIPRRLAAPFAR